MPGPAQPDRDAEARMAAAAALFAAADDGWVQDAGPAAEPAWLAQQDDPYADPLAGLDDDQIRAVLEREALGAGFTHRADAARAAARGQGGSGFAAGGPLDLMEPGAALAALTEDACAAGLARLTDDELTGLLLAERRLEARHVGIAMSAVAELDRRRTFGRPASSLDGEHVSAELAAALVLTGRSADCLLGLARGLAGLPDVLAALMAGKIDLDRAKVFAEELAALDADKASGIAGEVLGLAGNMTAPILRALLRRLILLTDADALRRRAEAARADTRVECWAEGSGNGALAGRELDRADAIAADARMSAIARELKDAGAKGTMDQIRAGVFLALLSGRDPRTLLPAPSDQADWGAGTGPSGSVHLVMPVQTWLGRSDAPGEAAGHGPLPAHTCRELASRLAGGVRWCVTQTGADGRAVAHACSASSPRPGAEATWLASLRFRILESGTCAHARQMVGYRPGGLLAHLIRVRQRTCGFPGCRRPAAWCDLDHTVPFGQGGLTCECNLSPLCRRHHRCKQAAGWKLEQPQPGTLVWTTPARRTCITYPESYAIC